MDHLGFRVEDVEGLKKDLKALVNRNPALSPKPAGTEGEIRLKLLAKCQHGQFQLADPDGVPIDVSAAHSEIGGWILQKRLARRYFDRGQMNSFTGSTADDERLEFTRPEFVEGFALFKPLGARDSIR